MTESLTYSVFSTSGVERAPRSVDSPRIASELWRAACRELRAGELDAAVTTLAHATLVAHAQRDPLEATIRETERLAKIYRESALQREHCRRELQKIEREKQNTQIQLESLMTSAGAEPPRQNLLARIIAIAGKRNPFAEPVVAFELTEPTVTVIDATPTDQLALPLPQPIFAQPLAAIEIAPPPKPNISAHLFGALRISIDDIPVGRCVSSRARSVFAYLVVNRDASVSRDVLMEQFWGDSDPKDARNSLNVALHSLRRACKSAGDLPIVHYKDGAYRLNTDLDLWTDVDDFLNLNERGRKFEGINKTDAAIEAYEQALALYQGDFLSDSPYEDWAAMMREKLRLLYLETLDRLSVIYFQREQFATCITLCQLILARDNCREDVHCRLMRCYARQNQHPLALRQYQACVEALQKELDVPPDEKTTALHEHIRKREWV